MLNNITKLKGLFAYLLLWLDELISGSASLISKILTVLDSLVSEESYGLYIITLLWEIVSI